MSRILIVHPETDVRDALEAALRNVAPKPLAVEWAPSLADGLRRARAIQPHVVLLDIGGERSLVLQAAADLRAPGRLIIGLYNPLILRGDLPFVREVTRAGVGDFVPLPTSEAELAAALAAKGDRDAVAPAEGQVLAFFSQKGGVGTTTLAVNTAVLMAGAEQVQGSVVLVDAAVQFGNAASFMGLVPERTLADYARDPQGGAALAACLSVEPISGLRFLAAPQDPIDGDRITPEDLTRVLVDLRRKFDFVVVDTSTALDLLTLAVLDSADKIFIVTEAITPTTLGTARLLKVLEDARLGGERLRVVLNRFSAFEGNLSERTVTERLGRRVDHKVPYDRAFVTAASRGRPLIADRVNKPGVEAALSGLGQDAARLRRQPVEVTR